MRKGRITKEEQSLRFKLLLEQSSCCLYQDKLRVIEEVFRLVGGIKDENNGQTV